MYGLLKNNFSSKPKTKEAGLEICLQFVEHEKGAEVTEALVEGSKNKNPKVAVCCVQGKKGTQLGQFWVLECEIG